MIESKQEYKIGDNLKLMKELPSDSIDTIITSPPYWGLRDYGVDDQIGLEPTLGEYHERLLEVTAECMRVLKPTGVMFWNHGDSYGGSWQNYGKREGKQREKHTDSFERRGNPTDTYPVSANMLAKSMILQNERLIIRMIDDQDWILRNRIIWHKPNGMPSSVTDRFSNKYEPVYMLVKNKKYWFDLDVVRVECKMNALRSINKNDKYGTGHGNGETSIQPFGAHKFGKNPGDVWQIPTQPYKESHFAVFPTALVEPMIKAACPAEICPVCGFIRERIIEKRVTCTSGSGKAGKSPKGKYENATQSTSGTYDVRMGPQISCKTIGWTSCECGTEWNAGTVLDPFAGSGTVGEVARNLNRNAILFELNPEYGKLIANRIKSYMQPISEWI